MLARHLGGGLGSILLLCDRSARRINAVPACSYRQSVLAAIALTVSGWWIIKKGH
jgi:hypothetical protein